MIDRLKTGLAALIRGEIKYQKSKLAIMSAARLRIDKPRKVHLPCALDSFSK